MGSGIHGICRNCGYEASGTVGGGMADFMHRSDAPAICRVCREVVDVNTKEEQPWLHCGQPVELIGRFEAIPARADEAEDEDEDEDEYEESPYAAQWEDYVLDHKHQPCPKCGKTAMWWESWMIFD